VPGAPRRPPHHPRRRPTAAPSAGQEYPAFRQLLTGSFRLRHTMPSRAKPSEVHGMSHMRAGRLSHQTLGCDVSKCSHSPPGVRRGQGCRRGSIAAPRRRSGAAAAPRAPSAAGDPREFSPNGCLHTSALFAGGTGRGLPGRTTKAESVLFIYFVLSCTWLLSDCRTLLAMADVTPDSSSTCTSPAWAACRARHRRRAA